MIKSYIKGQLFMNPDVTSVGWGFRYKNGKRTSEPCVVVGVKKKRLGRDVRPGRMIQSRIDGLRTDVQDRDIKAQLAWCLPMMAAMPSSRLPVTSQSLTQKRRPCPPGYSIGHTAITAGTLGAYVRTTGVNAWMILSNNHVLANSNQGKINDKIIQPGKADGGFSKYDLFALLKSFAVIKWDGDNGGGCNLAKRFMAWRHKAQMIEQPYPNLVDAAIAAPVNQGWVELEYPDGGVLGGMVELGLGDAVKKTGRTTERTVGMVEGVNTMVKVQYGTGIATFDDQQEFRASKGNFSEPGDSGSAILTMDNKIGGLLFAGGSGVTIANRIEHVSNILGVGL